jgi:predicted lipoprotein with Yx(FWY)xxD motif
MKNLRVTKATGAVLIVAFLLVACGSAVTPAPATTAPTTEPTEVPATESPSATEAPAATASPAATETQTAEAASTEGIPVTGDETIVKATVSENYGAILVDGEGRALYIFMNDTQNGDSSACTDECATEWEPFTSQGDPVAGAGVIQKSLGTITREDGTVQVTFNGWPLYYFSGDHGAGSTLGQGMEDLWFLIHRPDNLFKSKARISLQRVWVRASSLSSFLIFGILLDGPFIETSQ